MTVGLNSGLLGAIYNENAIVVEEIHVGDDGVAEMDIELESPGGGNGSINDAVSPVMAPADLS